MKSLKLVGLTFVVGVATGAGSLSLYNWMQVDVDDYASPRELFGSNDSGQDMETTRLLARIAEQRGEIERLKTQLEETPRRTREPDQEEELTEEELEQRRDERREEMRERFLAQMQEREEQQIQQLVDKYGLSEAQRQLLVQIFAQQREYMQARRSGEQVEPFNFDEAMASIMTDSQYAQYVEDTQNQIYSRASEMAKSQVSQVAGRLRLNDDQKVMMYEAINYTAQEMMIARQSGEDYNMQEIMKERLSTILSPEQFEAYQRALSSERRGGGDGRPGGGRPGGGGGAGGPGG